MFELPTATAHVDRLHGGLSAKWSSGTGANCRQVRGALICTQVGGEPVLRLSVRHSARPQANIRLLLLGSMVKYGQKLKLRSLTVLPAMLLKLTPALLLR